MTFALISLIVLSAVELILWAPPAWRFRRSLLCVLIPLLALSSGLLFGEKVAVWTGLVALLSAYRLFNLLRILENRLQPKQLYILTQRTSFWLIFVQAAIGITAGMSDHYAVPGRHWAYAAVSAQLFGAVILLGSTARHLRTTRTRGAVAQRSDKELPTLSVLVPARNETDDLEACLQSLTASDYPKLEILVLDDCSQNRHTPQIIKDYAHLGVRFIAGSQPPKHWLAKNYAYQQLVDEASGELLLFCGVDTRFQPGSLRAIVEAMVSRRKRMLSFIPRNVKPGRWRLESLFLQPARYAWELSLPRRLFRRPPVLSTCWLITRDELLHAGGFGAAMGSVSPESFFARHAIGHDDGYGFLRSDTAIGLLSAKSLPEQRATAVRVRYPQLHRHPESVAVTGLAQFFFLVAPFGSLAAGIALGNLYLAVAGGVAAIFATASFALVVSLTYRGFTPFSLAALPFAALYDIGLLNYSMWRYEFREVIWKGRNVCLPVLSRLPRQSVVDK